MIGWRINVYRLKDPGLLVGQSFFWIRLREKGGRERLRASVTLGDTLATWAGGVGATDWLEHLRIDGHVIEGPLMGGYPVSYFGKARHVVPVILSGPPGERWPMDGDIDAEALVLCSPDDWLLVEAWDQS